MITAKDKPKWYQFRRHLSNVFINIGRKIYPQNPEIQAFWLELMLDSAITGKGVVRIDPTKLNEDDLV